MQEKSEYGSPFMLGLDNITGNEENLEPCDLLAQSAWYPGPSEYKLNELPDDFGNLPFINLPDEPLPKIDSSNCFFGELDQNNSYVSPSVLTHS